MTQDPLPEDEGVALQDPAVTDAPAPREEPPAEPPPPPIEAPPQVESLAEQVYRESHTIPESTGPSDWVPNRPNIRPPEPAQEEAPSVEMVEGGPAEPEAEAELEHQSAADLIAAADAAQTTEELDAVEAQAEGRVTVLNAVAARRAEIA